MLITRLKSSFGGVCLGKLAVSTPNRCRRSCSDSMVRGPSGILPTRRLSGESWQFWWWPGCRCSRFFVDHFQYGRPRRDICGIPGRNRSAKFFSLSRRRVPRRDSNSLKNRGSRRGSRRVHGRHFPIRSGTCFLRSRSTLILLFHFKKATEPRTPPDASFTAPSRPDWELMGATAPGFAKRASTEDPRLSGDCAVAADFISLRFGWPSFWGTYSRSRSDSNFIPPRSRSFMKALNL